MSSFSPAGPVERIQGMVRSFEPDGLAADERAELLHAVSNLSEEQRASIDQWLEANYGGLFDIGTPAARLPLPDDATLRALATRVVRNGLSRVPDRPNETRHELNARLQTQDWTDVRFTPGASRQWDGSPVVVIAFEGTGAFEPRLEPGITAVTHTLQSAGHDTAGLDVARFVENALEAEFGRPAHWSGLAHGPRTALARVPELEEQVQWLSFPSEELEILASPEAYRQATPAQLARDIMRSSSGTAQGIEHAQAAMNDILRQAHARGEEPPTFAVVSHSSGGRSAVKFLEFARTIRAPDGSAPDIGFAFTIDPVREAHEAVGEAARELVNKGTEHGANWVRDRLGIAPRRVWPPTVGSRPQPESLYRVANTPCWVNFYQRCDTEGLKMDPRFGIHGSPVAHAQNIELRAGPGIGAAAHGEIAFHPQVRERFVQEIRNLLR